MLNMILGLIPTLCVIGVLIFIHELGHFVCAKLSGVMVEKFSIGFGPEIAKWKKNGTVYALSLIPFGGFVKMSGESIEEKSEATLAKTDFLAQSVFKRFMIVFSGPLMNYVLAIVFLFFVFIIGKPSIAPVVGELVEEYPAKAAGMQIGDEIVAINGQDVSTWDDMRTIINESTNEVVTVDVLRDEKIVYLSIRPNTVEEKTPFGDTHTSKKIGIVPSDETVFVKYGIKGAAVEALKTTYRITTLTYYSLYKIVIGQLNPKSISGPLGIMVITAKTAEKGMLYLMQLTAFLSISLAIFNLLPIPALDGGHLFFILWEAIMRKPVSFKLQERFAQVGFTALMVLMVLIFWNDAVNFDLVDKIKNLIPFIR